MERVSSATAAEVEDSLEALVLLEGYLVKIGHLSLQKHLKR
jgi:hypothetical protein